MERTEYEKRWRDEVKDILDDPRMRALKEKKIGYYYHIQDSLLLKIGAHKGKVDEELLNKYAKSVNAMIEEFVPPSQGWR